MKFNQFDRLVLGIIAALIVVNAALVWGGTQVGILPSGSFPAEGRETGMYGPIWIEFSEPMQTDSVEAAFSISGGGDGEFVWDGNRVRYVPDEPLAVGEQYAVSLAPGSLSEGGRSVDEAFEFSFTVRQPWILYLSYTDMGAEIYRISPSGGEPQALTDSGGLIYDFQPSPDGELIAYSLVNEENGIDIWLMDRDGRSARVFLDCGMDRCMGPSWSPDGTMIAYSRMEAGLQPQAGYGAARVWLAYTETGETARLFANAQKVGYGPGWSPDGRMLSYNDGTNSQIIILDLETGDEFVISSQLGNTVTWSPDSTQILYGDMLQTETGFSQVIYLVDLNTKDTVLWYGDGASIDQFGNPQWSPDGDWIAMTTWQQQDNTSYTFMRMASGETYGFIIDNQPAFIFSSYAYDPTGQYIVYQRTPLGVPNAQSQIILYDKETQNRIFLAENASFPAWTP